MNEPWDKPMPTPPSGWVAPPRTRHRLVHLFIVFIVIGITVYAWSLVAIGAVMIVMGLAIIWVLHKSGRV